MGESRQCEEWHLALLAAMLIPQTLWRRRFLGSDWRPEKVAPKSASPGAICCIVGGPATKQLYRWGQQC